MKNNYSGYVAGVILFAIIWIIGAFISENIPSINTVFIAIFKEHKLHVSNSLVTIGFAISGLVLALIFSLFMSFLVFIFPKTDYFFTPIFITLKSTPLIAFIPLIVLFFGFSIFSLIFGTFTICFYPLTMAGLSSFDTIPRKLDLYCDSIGASRWNKLKNIGWVYITYSIIKELKVAAPLSLVGTLVCQFLMGGNYSGLGGYLREHVTPHSIIPKYEIIVLCSLLGLALYLTVSFLYHLFKSYARI